MRRRVCELTLLCLGTLRLPSTVIFHGTCSSASRVKRNYFRGSSKPMRYGKVPNTLTLGARCRKKVFVVARDRNKVLKSSGLCGFGGVTTTTERGNLPRRRSPFGGYGVEARRRYVWSRHRDGVEDGLAWCLIYGCCQNRGGVEDRMAWSLVFG